MAINHVERAYLAWPLLTPCAREQKVITLGEYSASDKEVSLARHGKAALLPKLARHRPDVDALSVHHKQHGWDI